MAQERETSQRLAKVPAIGPITASAVVATIGDASNLTSARHLSAALGLTPKQNGSDGKARQGGISKGGNTYLRLLLFIGAISVVRSKRAQEAGSWLARLLERRPAKVVAIALANKTARVIGAMLRVARPIGHRQRLLQVLRLPNTTAKQPSLRIKIIKRSDDVKGFVVLPRRWVVQRTFSWFGRNRRLAKDYESLAATFASFVMLAAIQLGARRLARG